MNGVPEILLVVVSLGAFISAVYFYTRSQQETFNDKDSWKKKYKSPMFPAKRNWYTNLFKLTYKERFPLSGSFLVAFTDRYHRFQLFFKVLLSAAIVSYKPIYGILDGFIYFFLWGIVFTLTFRK